MVANTTVVKISRWLLAAILFILATPAGSFAAGKMNVLFLICDDLNCDLGSYGHPQVKSPNIDRLAERGMRFSRAYCQYPLCGPSRASFMTGLYPDQTTILGNAILLRERLPGVQSMSQMFIRKGYEAIRIGKIYHYGVPRDIGTDGHDDPKSWTRKFNPKGRDKTDESKVFSLRPGSYGGTLSWLAADGTDEEQTDGIAATEAVKLLKEYAANKSPSSWPWDSTARIRPLSHRRNTSTFIPLRRSWCPAYRKAISRACRALLPSPSAARRISST